MLPKIFLLKKTLSTNPKLTSAGQNAGSTHLLLYQLGITSVPSGTITEQQGLTIFQNIIVDNKKKFVENYELSMLYHSK